MIFGWMSNSQSSCNPYKISHVPVTFSGFSPTVVWANDMNVTMLGVLIMPYMHYISIYSFSIYVYPIYIYTYTIYYVHHILYILM